MTPRSIITKSIIAFITCAIPANAGIIVDQPPSDAFGTASDTAFYNEFGFLRWQQSADDFTLDADASIRQLTWWGFYGGIAGSSLDPPVVDETILVRLYAARPTDGLPGALMREISVVNAQRIATGRRVGVMGSPAEYRFDLLLAAPFEAVRGARYWLSFQQIGLPDSLFRWQVAAIDVNGHAFQNANVSDWTTVPPADLAFQVHDTPEPATLCLLAASGIALLWKGIRARKHASGRLLRAAILAVLVFPTAANAGIIVDQPPNIYFGSASDTAFYNEFGLLRWQQLADDFTLDAGASIRQLTWWGFYSGEFLDPPQGDETMRVRFYTARTADGLPGTLMREITVLNTQRVATGR